MLRRPVTIYPEVSAMIAANEKPGNPQGGAHAAGQGGHGKDVPINGRTPPGETTMVRPEVEIISEFPLSKCLPPLHDRDDRDEAEMQRLTASIETHGVQQTITAAAEVIDGIEYARTIDGWSRVLGSGRARKTTIPVRLFRRPLTDTESLLLTIAGNLNRTTTSHKDQLTWLCRLAELNPTWTQVEIARAINFAPAEVSKMFRISKRIPVDLLDKIGTGPGMIPPRAAYALTKVADESNLRELAGRVVDSTLKVESLEMLIARMRDGKQTRAGPKSVKARTSKGLAATIPVMDHESVIGELNVLADAVRKAQKHGLPLSCLPSLLK